MMTEHQTTREEKAYWQLFEQEWAELLKTARTVLREAESAAYAAKMVHNNYCFGPEEYEEATQKMRLAAAELTDSECGPLATLWRAALAAAASIDADHYDTPAGYRVYEGNLHHCYKMAPNMIGPCSQDVRGARGGESRALDG